MANVYDPKTAFIRSYVAPTGAVSATNTHSYDGSLPMDSELGKIIKHIRTQGTKEEKIGIVSDFVLQLSAQSIPENNSVSMNYLSATVKSWGTTANNDGTNQIMAEEILLACAGIWKSLSETKPDLIEPFARELFSQFMDMQTGPCPQGRTIRLWQVANVYVEWHPLFEGCEICDSQSILRLC